MYVRFVVSIQVPHVFHIHLAMNQASVILLHVLEVTGLQVVTVQKSLVECVQLIGPPLREKIRILKPIRFIFMMEAWLPTINSVAMTVYTAYVGHRSYIMRKSILAPIRSPGGQFQGARINPYRLFRILLEIPCQFQPLWYSLFTHTRTCRD